MNLPTHRTELRDVGFRSIEYPIALRDAVSLLIEERQNFVPIYMPGKNMNLLDARVIEAESRDNVDAELEGRAATLTINSFRGQIIDMLKGMKEWGTFAYVQGISLSRDLATSNPTITKPEDPRFSFKFRPKTFDLGLTGRLLEDARGNRFQESLSLDCSIYDAFDLALELSPQRIVAVDAQGKHIVVYEDDKYIGRVEAVQNQNGRLHYVFTQNQLDKIKRQISWEGSVQVLPTGGLNVVFNDFFEKTRKYDRGAILFGHEYTNVREFLSKVTASDKHLIWRVCANDRSENTPLIDCEEYFGLRNDAREMPENRNRLLYMPNKLFVDFGRGGLFFDRAASVHALTSLCDVVTDIWVEPFDRGYDGGWDIVYDKMRRITPDRPVPVITNEDMKAYYVLKESIARTTQTVH